jgi:tetratricopeptide (TPR) repeat protein
MYHTLGDTYLQMGKPLQAIEQYIRATEAAPNNPAAFNKLGVAYLDLQRPEEAVEPLQTALRLDPKFVEAAFHLGEAYERLGNKAAARDAYKQAEQQGAGTDWATRSAERLKALGN